MAETWSYDPGYLPGDPRHGRTPSGVIEYYLSRPAAWLIRCTYGPDALSKREAALPAHVSYLSQHKDRIRFVGPLLADDGATPTGSWMIVQAPGRADAEAFIAGEGFHRAGMFADVEIKRFFETSLEDRRQLKITPDPALQMFVCELIDGPDGAEIRKRTGPDHHRYQKSVMDRYVARGPMRSDDGTRTTGSLCVIEVEDRAAAEAFVAAEPMTGAGVFAEIRIDRWRFGKSIA